MSADPKNTQGAANGELPEGARRVNLRFLLAGGTATTALIVGAVILFGALGTYVAFDGVPGMGDEDPGEATIALGPGALPGDDQGGGAPEATATASPLVAGAVAAEPAAPAATAPPPGLVPGGAGPGGGDGGGGGGGDGPPGGTPPTEPPTNPPGTPPPGGGEEPSARPRLLGGTVGDLQNTAGNLGLELPLSEATRGLTEPLDDTLQNTVNGLGSLVNQPQLGDELTHTLNQLTGALLGEGGLTDLILGANRRP